MNKQIQELDRLFSEYIRKRAIKRTGGCERCLTPKKSWMDLQTAHMFTRRKKSTRWNEDNAVGLCGGCHMYLDSHPIEKIAFFRGRLEEEFELLVFQANTPQKPDPEAIGLYLNKLLREGECIN